MITRQSDILSTLVSPGGLHGLRPYRQHVRLDLALVHAPLDLEESVLSPVVAPGIRDQLKRSYSITRRSLD